jgi:molecular chaperone DnaK
MPKRSTLGFGIDFGTTNSVVSIAKDDGAPVRLLHDGRPHPSVIWYRQDRIVVGEEAKRSFNANVDLIGNRFIRSVKRDLGKDRRLDTGAYAGLTPAHEVASAIFKFLREDADKKGWSLGEAVLTVPVEFDGPQRADIRKAAEMAGIKVLALVHEPFAAVVGYYRSLGLDLSTLPSETILVFDWGGGTLDMTLVKSNEGRLEELAIAGLADVAGDRFDKYVESFAQDKFLRRNALPPATFRPTRAALDRLATEAERRKIELSDVEHATVAVASMAEHQGAILDLKEQLERPEFETLITDDMSAAMHKVESMLRETRTAPEEIQKVLLIGGTSEIPLLRREMAKLFGIRAQPVIGSQTVIADGAAIIAREGYEPFLSAPVQIELADRNVHTVFPYGSRVPHEDGKVLTLYCTDNRDGEARIVLRQGTRSRDGSSSRLQEILSVPVVHTLPLPHQHERVYAEFNIDEDLILRIRAHGAARAEVVQLLVHDLKFGLQLR